MKKLLTSLTVCGLALTMVAPAVLAADAHAPLKTEADIKFEIDIDPDTEIAVPNEKNEDPEIIELPGEGASAKGALRIEFVPHLRFGTSNNMTAGADSKEGKTIKYNLKGDPVKSNIAPFVQVRDGRGLVGAEASWELAVKATPFTAAGANADGSDDVLTNATIVLKGSKLTMDYGTSAEASALVAGQTDQVIKTNGTDSTLVMQTLPDKSTSGHRVSNVFDTDYTKGKAYTDEKATGVEFVKPKGKAPIANATYKSELTWTLTDAL